MGLGKHYSRCLDQHLLIIAYLPRVCPQHDEEVVDDFAVQLAVDCLMFLDYLQGYFTPENLNRIQIILRFGHQDQRLDVVLALPVSDQFGTMTWLIGIHKTELVLE